MANRSFVHRDKRTPQFVNAVRALEELLETGELGDVDRAYSEVVESRNLELLQKRYGTPKQEGVGEFLKIRDPRKRYSAKLPGGDHERRWKKKGSTDTFTSEPYELSLRELREFVAFCDEHKLDACISTGSRHFPSSCLLVVIRRKEDKEQPIEHQGPVSDGR